MGGRRTAEAHRCGNLGTLDELAAVVRVLQAVRDVESVVAVPFAIEAGDIRRFDHSHRLMGYLQPVPSERSCCSSRGVAKGGNGWVRHLIVECAGTYRHPPKVGKRKRHHLEQTTPEAREIERKAQNRLLDRYRVSSVRGMMTVVVCTAIARELAGSI